MLSQNSPPCADGRKHQNLIAHNYRLEISQHWAFAKLQRGSVRVTSALACACTILCMGLTSVCNIYQGFWTWEDPPQIQWKEKKAWRTEQTSLDMECFIQ